MGHHLLSDKVSPLLCFAACLSSVLPLASPLFCRSPLLCFAAHHSPLLCFAAHRLPLLCFAARRSPLLCFATRLSSVLPLAAPLFCRLLLTSPLFSHSPLASPLFFHSLLLCFDTCRSPLLCGCCRNSCCLVLLLFYLSPHQPLSSSSIAIAVDRSHHCHYRSSTIAINSRPSPSTVHHPHIHHHRLIVALFFDSF